MQGARGPQAASAVPEGAHLAGHIAEARRRADQDSVVLRQYVRRCFWGRLIGFSAHLGETLGVHGFRHAPDVDFDARNAARAFRYRIRHGFDMSIH